MKAVFLYFVSAVMRELGYSGGTLNERYWIFKKFYRFLYAQYQATHLHWLLSPETQHVQEEICCSTVLSPVLLVILTSLICDGGEQEHPHQQWSMCILAMSIFMILTCLMILQQMLIIYHQIHWHPLLHWEEHSSHITTMCWSVTHYWRTYSPIQGLQLLQ